MSFDWNRSTVDDAPLADHWPEIRRALVGRLKNLGERVINGRIDDDLLSEASSWFVEYWIGGGMAPDAACVKACKRARAREPWVRKKDKRVFPAKSFAVNKWGQRYINTGGMACRQGESVDGHDRLPCGECPACERLRNVDLDAVVTV